MSKGRPANAGPGNWPWEEVARTSGSALGAWILSIGGRAMSTSGNSGIEPLFPSAISLNCSVVIQGRGGNQYTFVEQRVLAKLPHLVEGFNGCSSTFYKSITSTFET